MANHRRRGSLVHRSKIAAAIVAATFLAGPLYAVDVAVTPTKFLVVDKLAGADRAKAVYVAKDPSATKGAGEDVEQISVRLDVRYANGSAAGAFVVPAGTASGWLVNEAAVAKYVNKEAPGGPTEVKVALIKPGKLLKLVGKGLGDLPLDVLGGGDPSGPVTTAFCVDNDGEESCHCSAFTGCAYKLIAGGTGAKLVCKTGVGDAGCSALEPPGTTTSMTSSTTTSTSTSTTSITSSTTTTSPSTSTTSITTSTTTTSTSTSTTTSVTTTTLPCVTTSGCYCNTGLTVIDTCRGLEWEKKTTAVDSGPDPANLHDVDNRYTWAGRCTLDTTVVCQPNAAAAATCAAQSGGAPGCNECDVGKGTCNPVPFGGITTIFDWVNQVNASNFAGRSDWRVPTSAGWVDYPTGHPAELESIVDVTRGACAFLGFGGPCIHPIFGPTVASYYWSASPASTFPNFAWTAFFFTGHVFNGTPSAQEWVRAVRTAS
jgi:hypothetical protein